MLHIYRGELLCGGPSTLDPEGNSANDPSFLTTSLVCESAIQLLMLHNDQVQCQTAGRAEQLSSGLFRVVQYPNLYGGTIAPCRRVEGMRGLSSGGRA
jgi:hypothetical protein